jgi:hypothetical protein
MQVTATECMRHHPARNCLTDSRKSFEISLKLADEQKHRTDRKNPAMHAGMPP